MGQEALACSVNSAKPCSAQVLSIDVLRQERAVTSGYDHTCRVWKIPDESQLVYRWDTHLASPRDSDFCR